MTVSQLQMNPEILNSLQELTGGLPECNLVLKFRNSSLSPKESTPETRLLVGRMTGKLLRELFDFCFRGKVNNLERAVDEKGLQIAMRRFVAVVWLMHSELLVGEDGQVLTLEQLSKLPQLDCTRCSLSLLAQRFGNQVGFRGRVQKRVGGKANYAASAKSGWEKRRSREAAAEAV
jgi:hypothetical protein